MKTIKKLIVSTKAARLGSKEAALREMREEKAGEIPDFLKRTETPEQEEKRRAKQAKADAAKRFSDSAGLKVKKPPEPLPPAIAKALAKDLKEPGELLKAGADAAMKKTRVHVEAIGKSAKKISPAIAKALREREKVATIAIKGKSEETPAMSKKPTKSAKPSKKPAPKKAGKINRYDWNEAEENAAKGKVPSAPDFSAETHKYFRGMLAEVAKLVKARDLKALKAFKIERKNGSPGTVDRYRKIAITALSAKSA